jgi:hypothetical protein
MSVNLFGRDASFAAQRRPHRRGLRTRPSVISLQPTREGNTVVRGAQALRRARA